jgi:hypothetical protein
VPENASIVTDSQVPPLCPVCCAAVTDGLQCDICASYLHGCCADLDDSTVRIMFALLPKTGWVCPSCRLSVRLQLQKIQSGQATLLEEVARLRSSLDTLSAEVIALKSSPSPPSGASGSAIFVGEVKTIVANDSIDRRRRARNLVVSGLAPGSSLRDDINAFVSICAQHFSVVPTVDVSKSKRLGIPVPGKIQHLLVVCSSDVEVVTIIGEAKRLRTSSSSAVADKIFVNRDLSPTEAKIAYEARTRRRESRNGAASGTSASLGLPVSGASRNGTTLGAFLGAAWAGSSSDSSAQAGLSGAKVSGGAGASAYSSMLSSDPYQPVDASMKSSVSLSAGACSWDPLNPIVSPTSASGSSTACASASNSTSQLGSGDIDKSN